MKKIIAIITLVIMIIGCLTGCGVQQNSAQNSSDNSAFIGEERAKEIALEKAGISADGVVFDRVELDRDDGVVHYEIEFRKGTVEYDADIKADDGAIIKWEIDNN